MEQNSEEQGVSVILPAMLAARTGNTHRAAVCGATVREVIAALDNQFPGMRFNLCMETGDLRPFVNIFVNGANIRYLSGLDTPISPGTVLSILPSVAGG